MDKEVKEFCSKYDAYVQDSHRMQRRVKRMPFQMWSESDPEIFQKIPYEEIKFVEVHMPEDRFRALLEHDEWLSKAGLYDNSYFNNNVSRVANLIVQLERETRIRHENPSVKIAWEKYQTMLSLVSSHYD
jgi:hypothetical protein